MNEHEELGEASEEKTEPRRETPFPVREDLNATLALWDGDPLSLALDALVNPTNERLNDSSGVSGRVFLHAGHDLVAECIALENCPTGDAVLTQGYQLPAKHIIHTVGPRYSEKYRTAAENALHSCYRRSLEILKEHGLRSIAFTVVNTERKGYPRQSAAHIAFRTIRRFLEQYGEGIETVILVADPENRAVYQRVLPLYFPRTPAEEELAVTFLPADVGNQLGETVIAERQIRLDTGFITMPEPTDTLEDESIPKRNRRAPIQTGNGFAVAQEDPDERRRREDALKPKKQRQIEENTRRYNRYLRMARDEDLRDMAELNFIYESGEDSLGRPVICLIASHLPAETPESLHRVLLYIIKTLDPIVEQDFNLIYFHTNIQSRNKPSFSWLREVYSIFNRKYKKNMKRVFIVHPTFWVRTVLAFARLFVSRKVWRKVHYSGKLMDLYQEFDPRGLRIPAQILEYDQDQFPASWANGMEMVEEEEELKQDGL